MKYGLCVPLGGQEGVNKMKDKIYIHDFLTGLRITVDANNGSFTIEQNNNLAIGINTNTIAKIIKVVSTYGKDKLYKALVYYVSNGETSVIRGF